MSDMKICDVRNFFSNWGYTYKYEMQEWMGDKDIIPNSETLSPAYIVFDNYEIILRWNRSLRFALAVCTLKDKFKSKI